MDDEAVPETWRARVAASWYRIPRPMRMVMAATGGVTLILAGVAMLVLPGPGLVVIALGVALLATEFAWAQHVMKHGKHHAGRAMDKVRSLRRKDQLPPAGDPSGQ